jgi:hypothetical protein
LTDGASKAPPSASRQPLCASLPELTGNKGNNSKMKLKITLILLICFSKIYSQKIEKEIG